MHWTEQRRHIKAWLQEMMVAKANSGIFGRPEHVGVSLKIVLYGGKPYDPDNLVASVKPVIDSLVRVGILLDDTRECVANLDVQQKSAPRSDHGTLIVIQHEAPADYAASLA